MDTQAIRAFLDEFHNPSIPLDQDGRLNPLEFNSYKAELEKKRLGFVLAVAEIENPKQKEVILTELQQAKESVLKRGFVSVDNNQVLAGILAGHNELEPFYQIQVIDGALLETLNRVLSHFGVNSVKPSPTENTAKSETPLQKKLSDYPELLSVKDITEIFGVSSRTVKNWEDEGYLLNVSETSVEETALGRKKRGKEKRYKKEAVIRNIHLNEKFNSTR